MSYDFIKEQFAQQAPFFGTVGVVLESVGPGVARATLENRKDISNHLGTLHAGALFTLGEGASGAAVGGAFADEVTTLRAVSTKASIDYLNIAKGLTIAEAKVVEPIADLRAQLDHDGKAACHVEVRLSSTSGKDVAVMQVEWLLLRRKTRGG
jgi:acyl-coenzyme A thioesterase PaaI-like protein